MGIPVKNLRDHPIALQNLSQSLDRIYRNISNWLHFAYKLDIESCVINQCRCLYIDSVSPTINLFGFLGATKPELSVKDLKNALLHIGSFHIRCIIAKNFKDEEKVSEAITNSSLDVLDIIALELDTARKPVANWERLANALGVPRTKYSTFVMRSDFNPTVSLVKYLYTCSEDTICLKDFMDCFSKMDRKDVIKKVEESVDSGTLDNKEAREVLKLGSDLLQNVADLLNKDSPGVKGWREFGEHFKVDPSIIGSLEREPHSPTTNIINWLVAARPATTIKDLVKALSDIKRFDCLKILKSYFKIEVSYDENIIDEKGIVLDLDDDDSTNYYSKDVNRKSSTPVNIETPMFGIQATEQSSSSIFQGDVRKFGVLSKSLRPLIGREKEKEELINNLTKNHNEMVVLHATPGCGKTELVNNVAHDIIKDPYGYTVVYVDSKEVFSIDDLAYKILTTSGINSFQKSPITQVIQLFANSDRDCVLIIENLDHMYHSIDKMNETTSNETGSLTEELPWQKSTLTSKKDVFHNFIKIVIKSAPKLKVLVTTWEPFQSLSFGVESMTLKLLDEDQSRELLRSRGVLTTNEAMLEAIVKCCGGIPLLLCAAGIILGDPDGAQAACMQFSSSPPEKQFDILCPVSLPEEQRLNRCLERYFERLKVCSKKVLILLSVFPNAFTLKEAVHVSKGSEIDEHQLQEGFQLLEKIAFIKTYNVKTDKYSLHPAIRSFGILEARKEDSLKSVFDAARWRFILYTFLILAEIEKEFFSTKSKSAIQKYKLQDENVREIARWCITEKNMDAKVKQFCVESFIRSQYVLLKLMGSHTLKLILCKFAQLCQKEKTLNKLYCECLILGGAKIVIGCLCVPYICPTALEEANWCFSKVLDALSEKEQPPRGKKKSQIDVIYNCKVTPDQAKAQFLLKYGKCLVRHGYKEQGFDSIKKGIEVRTKYSKKFSNEKNHTMLARSYEDLAGAYSYRRDHAIAISVREKIVLPIFGKHLGIHPFTATSQSQLARNYLELGEYDKALQANDIALKYRRALLGDHQDTARSLFDKGAILSEKAQGVGQDAQSSMIYEEALLSLEEALKLQESILDTPEEKVKTHQELAVVLTQLGRMEEAEEQMEKITECIKRMIKIHEDLPLFPNN